jgi:anti-anti-sigma factor
MQWSRRSRLRFAVDERDSAAVVLSVAGELDMTSTPLLLEAFTQAAAPRVPRIILDLSRLTFCDAIGVQTLYQQKKRLEAEGARLELSNPHSAVRRVLELSGMTGEWLTQPSTTAEDEAHEHGARLAGVMEAAIHAVSGSMGTAQYFDRAADTLHLTAHRGFAQPFVSFFETVRGHDTSCGVAAIDLRPVYVEDVTRSSIFAGSPELDVLIDAGVGSCVSIPITTARDGLLGVVSTHRPLPGPWNAADRGMLGQVQLHASEVAAA